MKQENCVRIVSENKKITILADLSTSLGEMHDFLLLVKGNVVERMTKVQDEEQEEDKKQKELEKKEEPKEDKK